VSAALSLVAVLLVTNPTPGRSGGSVGPAAGVVAILIVVVAFGAVIWNRRR